MDFKQKKFVKVRINASGKRAIGIVGIPPPHFRISDFLNSHNEFLCVKLEKSDTFIPKDAISYLEALEEGEDAGSRPRSGEFRQVTVTLKNHGGSFRGEIFVPDGTELATVLSKVRRFINFRNVRFASSPEHYGFIAVGRLEIVMIQEEKHPS